MSYMLISEEKWEAVYPGCWSLSLALLIFDNDDNMTVCM